MLYGFLVTLFIFTCILMVIVILMQASKGGGLASSFGGMGAAGGILGARGASSILQRATVGLGIFYGLLCLIISVMSTGTEVPTSTTQERLLDDQPQSTAPLTPGPATERPADDATTPAPAQGDENPDNN